MSSYTCFDATVSCVDGVGESLHPSAERFQRFKMSLWNGGYRRVAAVESQPLCKPNSGGYPRETYAVSFARP